MSYAPHDCSTEDEGVDEDMMFEFEEELSTRLTLSDSDRAASRASGARSPLGGLSGGLEDRARSPFPAFADRSSPTPEELLPMRPQNPVAFVLESANDGEAIAPASRNGTTRATFASLSASPFWDHGSPTAAMRMAAMVGSLSTPTAIAMSSDKAPSFDFNGRRKRKYSDDVCCVTPRVRPVPKRAKSFSCVGDMMLPDCGFKSISSTSFVPCVFESKPSSTAAGSVATGSPSTTRKTPTTSTQLFSMTSRSKSIQIPHRSGLAAHHRSSAFHHPRSSSGPARGTLTNSSRLLDAPVASSDPLSRQASSSWNASVEYFCRRSLDISSPLRTRFRDLVISSVGRAGGLKSP